MVFPHGLLGPMASPENLWILEISVKGSNTEKQAAISQVEDAVYSSKSAAIPDSQFCEFPHCYIVSSPDKLPDLCFLVLHIHFLTTIYPGTLIFSSTLLTTSVQQTSHLSFHL